MIENKKKLTHLVKVRIKAAEKNSSFVNFSPAVLEAMRLADLFESVHSQEYVLPLDALAGFSISEKKTKA